MGAVVDASPATIVEEGLLAVPVPLMVSARTEAFIFPAVIALVDSEVEATTE
jgi:hypothetical protein